MSMLNVSIDNGKYTVIQNDDGTVSVNRYGECWREVTGDKLILALAYEIDRLREELNKPKEQPKLEAEAIEPKYKKEHAPYAAHSADECDDPTCSHY